MTSRQSHPHTAPKSISHINFISHTSQNVMPNSASLSHILNFARDVVEEAGQISRQAFRQPMAVENKLAADFDPVTEADKAVEAVIREKLSTQFPNHSILGEETGSTTGSSDYGWIIDPIDGTRSFISGIPLWMSLLGLLENGKPVGSIIHQPYLQETFVGGPDGSFLFRGDEKQTLQTRSTTTLKNATLFCTDPNIMFTLGDERTAFDTVAEKAQLVRYGADGYAYCMLANGFVDLVIESSLQPYDILPLVSLIEGAGGVVTDREGNAPLNGGFVVAAATQELHQEVLKLINS